MSGGSFRSALTAALVFSLGAVAPSGARAGDHNGAFLYAQGGGLSPVTDLNDQGTLKFKTGWVAGGGLGYRFNEYVAVRGNLNYARVQPEFVGFSLGGTDVNRFHYDADVQLRYPTDSGVAPYVFGGVGAVTIDPKVPGLESFTKTAGKGGLGISYQIPDSPVAIFAEGTAWAYKWDRYSFDKTQVDIGWTAGVVVSLGR